MEESKLKVVFVGSVVDTTVATAILEENNIPFRIINSYQTNVMAGWVNPNISTDNAIEVFVASEDFDAAHRVLENHFNNL